MKPTIYTEEIKTVLRNEVYEINKEVCYVQEFINDKLDAYYYALTKSIKNGKAAKKFYHFPDINKLVKNTFFPDISNIYRDKNYDKLNSIVNPDVNINELVYFDHSNYLIWKIGDKYPLSGVYIIEEIHVSNEYYKNISDVFEHLKKHPYVVNSVIMHIFDDDYDKGVKIRFCLPQEKFNYLFDKYYKKDSYFDVKSFVYHQYDWLDLKQFQKDE